MTTTTLERQHAERRNLALRLLSALGAPAHDVEDLTQDSLLRFYTRGYAEQDLDEGRERALLARITYSTYIDSLRRRRPMTTDELLLEDGGWRPPSASDGTVDRVRDLVARARLTDDDQRLLHRRYDSGDTIVAIAADLDLHVNTVRRRLDAVLERLRRIAGADTHGTTTRSS